MEELATLPWQMIIIVALVVLVGVGVIKKLFKLAVTCGAVALVWAVAQVITSYMG